MRSSSCDAFDCGRHTSHPYIHSSIYSFIFILLSGIPGTAVSYLSSRDLIGKDLIGRQSPGSWQQLNRFYCPGKVMRWQDLSSMARTQDTHNKKCLHAMSLGQTISFRFVLKKAPKSAAIVVCLFIKLFERGEGLGVRHTEAKSHKSQRGGHIQSQSKSPFQGPPLLIVKLAINLVHAKGFPNCVWDVIPDMTFSRQTLSRSHLFAA